MLAILTMALSKKLKAQVHGCLFSYYEKHGAGSPVTKNDSIPVPDRRLAKCLARGSWKMKLYIMIDKSIIIPT